jgi:hypothetical protein
MTGEVLSAKTVGFQWSQASLLYRFAPHLERRMPG